jgi:hypothetical protein
MFTTVDFPVILDVQFTSNVSIIINLSQSFRESINADSAGSKLIRNKSNTDIIHFARYAIVSGAWEVTLFLISNKESHKAEN